MESKNVKLKSQRINGNYQGLWGGENGEMLVKGYKFSVIR